MDVLLDEAKKHMQFFERMYKSQRFNRSDDLEFSSLDKTYLPSTNKTVCELNENEIDGDGGPLQIRLNWLLSLDFDYSYKAMN